MQAIQKIASLTSIDVFNQIRNYENEIKTLKEIRKRDKVTSDDVVIQDLTKKEFLLKEQKVKEVHFYKITETEITKNRKRVRRWQTSCGDKRPRYSSYESLIEQLYDFYFGSVVLTDYSFKRMFEAALDEKIATERPKEKTIRDYHSSYKAFITDKFGAKDIRLITPSEMKTYIQDISREQNPTKKRLYKFKGILNLVFNYAIDPERRYIDVNPVPSTNRVYAKKCSPEKNKPEKKAFQPEELELIRNHVWKRVHSRTYDVNGYAILFSSETGVREGEIPSLKWEDITENKIHIHSQQNDERRNGVKTYYYNPTTKNEKGISNDGRYIPISKQIRIILK